MRVFELPFARDRREEGMNACIPTVEVPCLPPMPARNKVTTLRLLACAAVLLVHAGSGIAAPGDLDPTFNGGKLVLLDLSKTAATGTALHSAQVDAAGRIVVAGFTLDEDNQLATALGRLQADGTPDSSFGDAGARVIQAGAGGGLVFSMLQSLVARPGGGWAATGGASASDGRQAALVLAVDDAGNPDLNFGTGGSTRAQLAGASPAYTLAFAGGGAGGIDANGELFLAHPIILDPMVQTDTRLAVAKFTSGGQLAAGFAGGGVYVNTFSQAGSAATTYGSAALPTPDGILVAGSTLDAAGRSAFLLARLTANGALDGSFGGGAGYRVVQAADPAATVISSSGMALALGPGGLIYLAGTANDAAGHSALAVARFSPSGALDETFRSGGVARVQTGSADPGNIPGSFMGGAAVHTDGTILLVGSSGSANYTEMVVVRLTPNGDPDTSFGVGGVVRLQPATVSEPETFGFGATIAPDGNTLLATGQMRQAVGGRGVVARIMLATPTTTSTLPDSCAPSDSLAAALCQLEALNSAIAAGVPPGRLRDRLSGLVAKSSSFATASGQQTGRLRRKSLKRALSALNRLQRQLRTKKGRHTIAPETLSLLADDATQIATILTLLRLS
jgi:uncharacterized delta-60 repeat protein